MNTRLATLALLILGLHAPPSPGQDAETPAPKTAVAGKVETKKADATAGAPKAKGKVAKEPEADPATYQKAVLGGGCFWCLEAIFERIPGVKNVVSGYAGGTLRKPSYSAVCTGTTGHAEVVQITFDPEVISYEKLLEAFWICHDPTTPNQQGPDFGPQYRSIILVADEDQRKTAARSMEEANASGHFGAPIVTEIVPLRTFWPAEKHHQDYFRRNRSASYCRMTIAPKLQEFLHKRQMLDGANSPAAAPR